MFVKEVELTNIRSFESVKLDFSQQLVFRDDGVVSSRAPTNSVYPWITLLGENGAGKSTILQSLGLLLAGPEAAAQLVPRPAGWLRDESKVGQLHARILQGPNDPGIFGEKKRSTQFGYTFYVTGEREVLSIRNKRYAEPVIVENPERNLSWLREHAFVPNQHGWFAAGYGPFRRLTRSSRIIVPTLERPIRSSNFSTQFDDDRALATFEQWLTYLDYRIAKENDPVAQAQMDLGVAAINKVLPNDTTFDRVHSDGRITFVVGNQVVATTGLSDGYRSILALVGDLVWRLGQAFPNSRNPLAEEGVVLIDELDIHLHPVWQRSIADLLRDVFPRLQFIVGTHSAFIAAGAGPNALTLRFHTGDDGIVQKVDGLAWKSVDRVLQSEAFGLDSVLSPKAAEHVRRFLVLDGKRQRSRAEEEAHQTLFEFMQRERPLNPRPDDGSLDARIEAYLDQKLNDEPRR